MSSSSPSPWPQFFLGIRLFVPVAISIAAYGLVWGVLARQAGLSELEVVLMSSLVFAGASQFVAIDLWVPDAPPILAIVVAVGIINLRLLLMSATLRPLMRDTPRWRAALIMFFVADEQWAMTMAEMNKGRGSVAFLLGVGMFSWLSWTASTITGRLLGSVIADPTTYGLDFAFTATFLALLLGMWRGRGDLVPWAIGALVAILTVKFVPGQWYVITGGLSGSLAGALAETARSRHVAG